MVTTAGVIVSLVWALVIAVLLRRVRFYHLPGLGPGYSWMAFAAKLLGAAALWYIYTGYYSHRDSNDAFRYFDDARVIHGLWKENREYFWRFMLGYGLDDPALAAINEKLHCWTASYSYGLTYDGQTMIRLNVLMSFVSGGYYAVHALLMCVMSFTGLVALYRTFFESLRCNPLVLFAACFLLPSVVFWSSSVLKEAPLLCALGLFLLGFTRLMRSFSALRLTGVLVLFVFLFYLKEYVIIAFLPGLLFFLLYHLRISRRPGLLWVVTMAGCFMVATQAGYFFSGGDLLHVLAGKQAAFIAVASLADAGSLVSVPPVTDVWHYLLHHPQALALTYLRPVFWEADSLVMLAAALENLCYALMLVAVVWRFRLPGLEYRAFLLMCLSFVLILGGIIGTVVPILGATVRYRIVALPFLVVLCAACVRPWPWLTKAFAAWRGAQRPTAA